MNSASADKRLCKILGRVGVVALAFFAATSSIATQKAAANNPVHVVALQGAESFATPEQAAGALIEAAEKFDVGALVDIFGRGGEEVVLSGEYSQDRQRALDFAAHARQSNSVALDPKTQSRAFLIVGSGNWPFPVPIVKRGSRWQFDAAAGLQELEYRRIGANELDAIKFCRGYVEAQYEYAFQPRAGYDVNQYAQHIISAPGEHDGLVWQNPDGTWDGPIGESAARAIEQGYSFEQGKATPYHGYFFKVLTGQGPDAPLGEMDYLVKGLMIGGFALIAAPAEYGETGFKTFIVSQDGVVYQKDLGPETLKEFQSLQRFNPDRSWTPVPDDE
jgi:Protein of unknown function (DUF2950)